MTETSLENIIDFRQYQVSPLAAVIQDKNGHIGGVADSRGKYDDHKIYAKDFNRIVRDYFSSEDGKAFLKNINFSLDQLDGIGSVEMKKDVIAAMISYLGKKYMVTNGDFDQKVNKVAKDYDVDTRYAKEFVLHHETFHAKGYKSEVETAQKQLDYYNGRISEAKKQGNEIMQKKYETLAEMAERYIAQQKDETSDNQQPSEPQKEQAA